ncbi:MAG: DUF6270 domain-containing protein [Oscillospiraceae bacterium]
MDIKFKKNSRLEGGIQLFLHGSDMLKFAFESQNEYDKIFLNASAFETDFRNIICNKFRDINRGNNHIIIDFIQTASTVLYEVKNSYVHSLEDTTWQRCMDEYIYCISQYFKKDKMILVRTTIPKIRANFRIIRPFFSEYNDDVTRLAKQFEDYFISKVNPYVINLSRYYFLEKNHKCPNSNVCFESLYNQDILNHIQYIISNQSSQKTFDTPNYEFTLRRFLQFYENLYDKQMMFTILDKTDLIDQIVLNMSRHSIEDNITDICDLKKCKYHSYEEIVSNHDFKENHNLKKIVLLVIHILNKDITNPQLDYSIVFQENLKVIKSLSDQVSQKLMQLGLAQNITVTIFNVKTYHTVLFLYVNKRYKKAITALFDSYHDYTKPILIDGWGSCVSRVPLNLDSGKYKVNTFISRCCLLSEFDEPIDTTNIDFLDMSFGGGGWSNRCFRDSLQKVSKNKVIESKAEWLIIDFFDLINELAVFRNAVIDFSEDNRNTNFLKKVLAECKPFSFYDKPDGYIKERMDKFINLVKNKYHNNIILVNLIVKEHYLDGQRKIKIIDVNAAEQKNKFVDKWQNYFCKETNCYCIDIAKYFLADDQSIFGASIVHYEEAFNQEVFKYIDFIIQQQPKKRFFDDYAKALKVERLIDLKSNNDDLSLVKLLFQYSDYDYYLFSLSLEELKEMQAQEGLNYHHLCMNTTR